jgi:hypothetical protein
MAKEVGDRAGEGMAYANLGNAYWSQGDFSKAIEYHAQHLAIAKEVGDLAGEARRTGTSATRIGRRGTSSRPSTTTRSTWRLQRRLATGWGRARRTRTSATRMGGRAGQCRAHGNLGTCHMPLNEFKCMWHHFHQFCRLAFLPGRRHHGMRAWMRQTNPGFPGAQVQLRCTCAPGNPE